MSTTELFDFNVHPFSFRAASFQAVGEEGHRWVLLKLMKQKPLSQALLKCSA